jgi:DDE superfamily endonuclease
VTLFTTVFVVCGRVNFANLSRYSELSEKTYRRHFKATLGFEALNQQVIEQVYRPKQGPRIAAVDCTFVGKSGRHTAGLDLFYNGTAGKAQRGLEWSVIAVIDVDQGTGYTLSSQQTEAGLSQKGQAQKAASQTPIETPTKQESKAVDMTTQPLTTTPAFPCPNRMDFYLGHLAESQSYFPQDIRYVVADAFYSKVKWVNGVVGLGLHAIGKLRVDANLKVLYTGVQKPKGRRRHYDGKLDCSDLSLFEFIQELDKTTKLYTALVYSVALKRKIRLVYLLKVKDHKRSYILLFCTDLEIQPYDLYRFYKARFHIEFIFRDAKQFTGLEDCQSCDADKLDFHFNTSLTALNLAKADLRQNHASDEPISFSIASYKRLALNEHLLERFISMFALDPTLIKSQPAYEAMRSYGLITP